MTEHEFVCLPIGLFELTVVRLVLRGINLKTSKVGWSWLPRDETSPHVQRKEYERNWSDLEGEPKIRI